jgi:phospholipid/cholesterol/gamma-HCH transport system substrate-binding protein
MTHRSIVMAVARRFWLAIGIVAVIAGLLAVRASRTTDHSVRASFDAAVGLRSGMDVQLDGLDVGKVREVSYDHGRADVVLGIDDGPGWPLPRGTRAVLRHGTTIGSATRRVDLVLGPKGAPPIPDGGVMPSSSTQTPVEWDEVLGTFDRATRAAAQKAATRGAAVLGGRSPALAAGLDAMPGGSDALAGILEDLHVDRAMLDRLFPLTDRVTRTLARHEDAIRALVLVGRRTLQAFADRSVDVGETLSAFPPALAQVTTSLRRLDRTASGLRPTLAALAPGARSLSTLDRTLTPAIRSLRTVTSPALELVAEVDRAAPPLRRLLADLGPLLHDDGIPALQTAAPMLACFAPYAPELAGFLSNESSWNGRSNGRANYGRYHIIGGSSTLTHPVGAGSLAAAAALPGVLYARALRPGELAGNPRDIDRCGYTPELRDPDKDPQARR